MADEDDPTITSDAKKVPSVVPTLSVFVVTSHVLTLAFAPEMDPVTSSLYWNVPIPVIIGGLEIVAIPVPEVYPIPASDIRIWVTKLSVLITTLPIAVQVQKMVY